MKYKQFSFRALFRKKRKTRPEEKTHEPEMQPFCLTQSPTVIVTAVECIDRRQCYDKTWRISGSDNGTPFYVDVVRDDIRGESVEELCSVIREACCSVADIKTSLDERDKIRYD